MAVTGLVVVVLAVTALLMSGVGDGDRPPSASGPVWDTVPPTTVPAGSRLTATATQQVVSPVSSSAQPSTDRLTWQSGPDELDVAWGGPAVPQTSGAPTAGLQGQTAQSGYTVTDGADLDSHNIDPSTLRQTKVSIANHDAVESTAARSPSTTVGVQANRWISWPLHDGRFVHVWKAYADEPTLLAFARTFAEYDVTLARHLAVGVMMPGLSTEFTTSSPGQYGMTWCPAHFSSAKFELVGEPCVGVFLSRNNEVDRIELMINGGPDVQTGKLTVHTGGHQAYALPANGFSVVVNSDDSLKLTPVELATIINSVRYDPSIPESY
ncbi:hypothetical protein ABIB25_005595 [Nakamurella sp. UYEF19]|uniref:hypothetical protein n=1 Tax=Nakamurella sp. UYEF19 TaxID=1756392 RepID=UPI0033950685